MSRDLNKVMIIGRLGKDPEMRQTSSGKPVTRFSVATNRSWKAVGGGRKTETEWFNIVAWGSLAEVCNEYLVKGQRVYLEGRLQTRSWEDSTGLKRSTTEVIAGEMIMLDRSSDNDNDEPEELFDENGDMDEDEFPF